MTKGPRELEGLCHFSGSRDSQLFWSPLEREPSGLYLEIIRKQVEGKGKYLRYQQAARKAAAQLRSWIDR